MEVYLLWLTILTVEYLSVIWGSYELFDILVGFDLGYLVMYWKLCVTSSCS